MMRPQQRQQQQQQQQHRWLMLIMMLTTLCLHTALAKSTAAKLPKKFIPAVHALPAKAAPTHRSLLTRFPIDRLSAEDASFLRALDKQFVKYGNVKIKVENVTADAVPKSHGSGKKRTINNELGYGYHDQSHSAESSYSFSAPKFQIYPYSQHDIPPLPSYQQQQQHQSQHQHQQQQHQPQHQQHYGERVIPHSIEIQPSQSFELHSTPYGYQTVGGGGGHQQQQQQQQHYEVPVIVLRIPGPHKYAAHLQHLLQQYLELRAAEYISAAQQQEAEEAGGEPEPEHVQHQHYQQPQQQHQQQHYEPEYQPSPPQQHQQHYYHQPQPHGQAQQFVLAHQQLAAQQRDIDEDSYHPSHQQQPTAAALHSTYGVPATSHAGHADASHLPIQENYPSHLHTRVIYTGLGAHTGAKYFGDQHSQRTQAERPVQHNQQQHHMYLYEYQQQHPAQQQQHDYEHEQQQHQQQQPQHTSSAAAAEDYDEPTADAEQDDAGQQQHYHQPEQMAQLSGGYHDGQQEAAAEEDDEPQQQQQQQHHHHHHQQQAYASGVDPNLVSITHRSPTAADYADYAEQQPAVDEHTHTPRDEPYNYHAHGAGNEHRHQAADVHERAQSRYA